jgi:hypothetical protein
MNSFSLINIGSCYYDNSNNIITISAYKNKNHEELFTIEYETSHSWDIEWFKNKNSCNELRKVILWLNNQGSEIKQIDSEICLIGVNLHNIHQHITTDTFNKIPFMNNYIFDYDIFNYIEVDSLKTHLNNQHKIAVFDNILS